MSEIYEYSPEDIIQTNLGEIATRLDGICEQETAHLSELADEIVSVYEETPDGFLTLLPVHTPLSPESPPICALAQNEVAVKSLRTLHCSWQKVQLCIEIQRSLAAKGHPDASVLFPYANTVNETAYNRVVYQKSSYTDSAYLRFAPLLETPRATSTASFLSACEAVYNGMCEFCILPLENTKEGLLYTFVRLIQQYDLKFAATCDLADADASRTSRFALLRKELSAPLFASSSELRVSCAVPLTETNTISDLLQASRLCGLRICHLNSSSVGERESEATLHLTVSAQKGKLDAFLLYLAMDLPTCRILGLYPHLSLSKKK